MSQHIATDTNTYLDTEKTADEVLTKRALAAITKEEFAACLGSEDKLLQLVQWHKNRILNGRAEGDRWDGLS